MANALETKLSNAKDVARKFLVEEITEQRVGEYLGFVVEGENVATHKFKCVDKAYVGWNWAVTLAVVDQSSDITVSEILLYLEMAQFLLLLGFLGNKELNQEILVLEMF